MVFIFLFFLTDVNDVSLIGLGLTYVISMSGLMQYVARLSTDIENLVSLIFILILWTILCVCYLSIELKLTPKFILWSPQYLRT